MKNRLSFGAGAKIMDKKEMAGDKAPAKAKEAVKIRYKVKKQIQK